MYRAAKLGKNNGSPRKFRPLLGVEAAASRDFAKWPFGAAAVAVSLLRRWAWRDNTTLLQP